MYDKQNHYPVQEILWDEEKAIKTIQSICNVAITSYNPRTGWPCHPMDRFSGSNFYMGSSGCLWGIDYLTRENAIETKFEIESYLDRELKDTREWFKTALHKDNSSYLFGELPILMLQYKSSQDETLADSIYDSIKINNSEPVRELMWGTAGTMVAANFMSLWEENPRWRDIFQFQAQKLLDDWEPVSEIGYLWSPELYGDNRKYLGPVHGFAGNVIPLIKGKSLQSPEVYEEICLKAMVTLVNTATSNEKYANWANIFIDDPKMEPTLVQYCHGAPGIISSMSELPQDINTDFDQLLEKGGELVWVAGPLKKGSNLCHGTSGNGYSFLKLFERTQNELWLNRARVFAMNAIEQYEFSKALYRQDRYSLWTGDIGLAIYLWDCLRAQAKFPTIDVF